MQRICLLIAISLILTLPSLAQHETHGGAESHGQAAGRVGGGYIPPADHLPLTITCAGPYLCRAHLGTRPSKTIPPTATRKVILKPRTSIRMDNGSGTTAEATSASTLITLGSTATSRADSVPASYGALAEAVPVASGSADMSLASLLLMSLIVATGCGIATIS